MLGPELCKATMATEKPKQLMLKDLLELDCESSNDGFRCYPRRLVSGGGGCGGGSGSPVRYLLDGELLRFGRSPLRSPSLARSPTLSKLSHLSRSLSRRLRGGLWRRRGEAAGREPASPVVSSCSSDSVSGLSDKKYSSGSVRSPPLTTSCSECAAGMVDGAAGDEQKELQMESMEPCNLEMDDKEQRSPVSVMDFPLDDDGSEADDGEEEEDSCLHLFRESLEHVKRKKAQLLHKIRRFESLAELGAVDLEACFAAASESDDHATTPGQPDEHHDDVDDEEKRLLELLTRSAGIDHVSEMLVLDFLIETRCWSEREAMGEAKEWLEGGGLRWGLSDVLHHGEAAVVEMERTRRWLCAGEEEREVGATVEGLVMEELVDELVRDSWLC